MKNYSAFALCRTEVYPLLLLLEVQLTSLIIPTLSASH